PALVRALGPQLSDDHPRPARATAASPLQPLPAPPPVSSSELPNLEATVDTPEIWLGWTIPGRFAPQAISADLVAQLVRQTVTPRPRGQPGIAASEGRAAGAPAQMLN